MKRTWIAAICLLMATDVSRPRSERRRGRTGAESGPWREQIHWVPMRERNGGTRLLWARTCRPRSDAPARVVLINHGNPPNESERPSMRVANCESEAVQWFLMRGYVVMLGLRRGYGATGGNWAENYSSSCAAEGYAEAGQAGAEDIDALVTYATGLPYARRDGAVVVGQSAGGWATDAYDSLPHPKVIGMVSMAGGRGGHVRNMPNNNCRPDELACAAGMSGRTASTPMLWVFTANDTFFAPTIAVAMHAAFTRSGGNAELIQLGPYGSDGHTLFFGKGGSAIWGPLMERYLASRRADP